MNSNLLLVLCISTWINSMLRFAIQPVTIIRSLDSMFKGACNVESAVQVHAVTLSCTTDDGAIIGQRPFKGDIFRLH